MEQQQLKIEVVAAYFVNTFCEPLSFTKIKSHTGGL